MIKSKFGNFRKIVIIVEVSTKKYYNLTYKIVEF